MSQPLTVSRPTILWHQKRHGIFRFFHKIRDGWFRLLDADIKE